MAQPEPTPRPDSEALEEEFKRLRGAVSEHPELRFLVERIPDETPKPEVPDSPADFSAHATNGAAHSHVHEGSGKVHATPQPATALTFDDFDRGTKLAPRPMRLADKKQALEARQEIFLNAAIDLNAQLKQGRIRTDEWLRRMMGEVRGLHTTAYAIGYSGRWDEISSRDWGVVGGNVQRQYRFLRAWRRELMGQDPEDISLAKLNDRAQKYGQAASESFEKGYSAEVGMPPNILPAYPGDGTTACMTRCKCRWAINILDKQNQDFDCTWTLGVAEHCETCIERASEWVQLEIRNGVLKSDPEPIFER